MKRIIIEKKRDFNVEAKRLFNEFKGYLGIEDLEDVRELNVYEIIKANKEELKRIIDEVLYEEHLDLIYEDELILGQDERAFRVETHRGQFNQREDSTRQLIQKYMGLDHVDVIHSKIIVLKNISDKDFERVKSYYINPTELTEIPLDYFSYEKEEEAKYENEILEGFIGMDEADLLATRDRLSIAMDIEDISFCQDYFKSQGRDPSVTEIKTIDTYWSDHCRHTTFNTEITDIEVEDGKYKEVFERAINDYLQSRQYVYGDRDKAITLMDLGTINGKKIKKKGLLDDKEETDEINAASIEVDIDVDGRTEKWLLMFKNETHNHPTEIEPFGGAGTCLGGGIRDPLSGRAFVYQAMRITGSADPRQSFEDTIDGKLPQRKITQTAMEGFSSYGNQIGATTGYVNEFYDQGFLAKRLEIGALVAAAPKDWVRREKPKAGDLVLLIGGRTGRDGVGAAVGSSQVQEEDALQSQGAEVQKGNAPLERKIIRLFRNPKATKLIKKCNDFGAGGVAVAVGELADGLDINLDKVPLKYPGLKGWEIALSESQERMAVVIDREDLDEFMYLVGQEDLEGSLVAEVTDSKRVQMKWKGHTILDISRDFLDSNGVTKKSRVRINDIKGPEYIRENPDHIKGQNIREDFINNMRQLNTGSQKGLIERFDNTINSGTVLMQLGGKYQETPQDGMVAKLPVLDGDTKTCSIMTCGYDPKMANWSTFHGGYYAVIESLARLVALGGDYRKARLTFQEYYESLGEDPTKWAKPFTSLLGAFTVQKALDIPSIGGKDSMSGSFEDLKVPPSLFSFAVVTENVDNIISREFKKVGSKLVLVKLDMDENELIDFEELEKNFTRIKELIENRKVLSSSTVKFGGIGRSISEMAFGNKIGSSFNEEVLDILYKPLYGSIILEIGEDEDIADLLKGVNYLHLGSTIEGQYIEIGDDRISLDELKEEWEKPLGQVFPVEKGKIMEERDLSYGHGNRIKRLRPIVKPRVLIPIFTGNHGEYDMARSFERAGGEVETLVFRNSYEELAKKIGQCQILGFANGSILGNEPEVSGKLMKIIFNNPILKDALDKHLKYEDGLILGNGSGFKALISLGLLPGAYIGPNKSGQFISTMTQVKLTSNLSPWTNEMDIGDTYSVPIASNEARVLIDENKINPGQITSLFTGHNPTGSDLDVESVTSNDGRVLGTVTSIDRIGNDIYKNVEIKGSHKIFQSGINYYI